MEKIRHYEEVEFLYDSEAEKESHSEEMLKQGYLDSGQSMKLITNIAIDRVAEYRDYGRYYKFK